MTTDRFHEVPQQTGEGGHWKYYAIPHTDASSQKSLWRISVRSFSSPASPASIG